ncbi:MAG: hypothetical protein HYY16_19800 [Planctomycetes bacterium]|nr:hypothetical protein [Planctomycetota bacterium]
MGVNGYETSVGGFPGGFPETALGLIARIRGADHASQRDALDELCRQYWKPVYVYLRLIRRKTVEDAKDLTQAFFLWLMESDALEKYDPQRGRFRQYLKGVLHRFASYQERSLHRLKRGGGVRTVPIDDVAPLESVVAASGTIEPGRAFDQAWAVTVSIRAIDRVRQRFLEGGKGLSFRIFEDHILTPSEDAPMLVDLAKRLGMSEAAVRKHLFIVREAVRAEIHAELAEMARDERDLEDEWNVLFNGG